VIAQILGRQAPGRVQAADEDFDRRAAGVWRGLQPVWLVVRRLVLVGLLLGPLRLDFIVRLLVLVGGQGVDGRVDDAGLGRGRDGRLREAQGARLLAQALHVRHALDCFDKRRPGRGD
jgi:hypothetical protein